MVADPSVFDFSQDISGADRHRLTLICPEPAYVKQASAAQLSDKVEDLPAHVFAIPSRRLYQCHTKAATWMSALYFGDKCDFLPEHQRLAAAKGILKAAGFFGIDADVRAVFAKLIKHANPISAPTPDSHYALVWTDDAGNKHRNYPLRNAREVKVAAEWFVRHRDDFAYAERRSMATRMLERAVDLRQPLDESEALSKMAGYGCAPSTDIADAWEARAKLTAASHPTAAKSAFDAATAIRKERISSRDADTAEQMVELMDKFDQKYKLARFYAKGLERPEDAVYRVTEKAAADFVGNHVELRTGTIYEKAKLARLKLATVQDWMGTELARAVGTRAGTVDIEKLADILAVLPRPDAAAFDRMAAACRIPPTMLQKAAAEFGFTREELAGLKQVYVDARAAAASMPLPGSMAGSGAR